MLRYLRRLADRTSRSTAAMIPLGSCTMKLNATTEMEPSPGRSSPTCTRSRRPSRRAGYRELIDRARGAGCAEVTGYDAVSLQPNAGSQGELAGLLAIRGYHRAQRRRRSATSA